MLLACSSIMELQFPGCAYIRTSDMTIIKSFGFQEDFFLVEVFLHRSTTAYTLAVICSHLHFTYDKNSPDIRKINVAANNIAN